MSESMHADIDRRLGIVDPGVRMSCAEDGAHLAEMPGVMTVCRSTEPETDILRVDVDDSLVTWALLEWIGSCTDGSDMQYEVIARGQGIGGSLREPRHTYFGAGGDHGYVFYVDPAQLAWAFDLLGTWFDW